MVHLLCSEACSENSVSPSFNQLMIFINLIIFIPINDMNVSDTNVTAVRMPLQHRKLNDLSQSVLSMEVAGGTFHLRQD